MNKSDIIEIIEGVALILGGAVVVNAILNLSKREDTNENIKDLQDKAIQNANKNAIDYSQKNVNREYAIS